ncbi:MAG: class I SAM-dependent methyltransferase [Holophagales bacterium]|jgi:16S rRNA (guanine527-N7)-methyltransferase|nr:class I SAM-dependent methyltransferase [Holophagales bacterium]
MFTPVFPAKISSVANSYLCLLDRWNNVHSLTALPPEARFEALLLDSAALLPRLESVPADSLIADFGSGMGIPAVVIAAHRPDLRVAAIDRNHKKMAFVRQAALELKLDNLRAICESIESLTPLNAHFGTAKAVGSLNLLLGWWKRHSARRAPFFAFEGPDYTLSDIGGEWNYEIYPYRLPSLGQRAIVEFISKLA